MSYRKFQIYFFVAVLLIMAALTLFVFRSYLVLLALGGVLAIVSSPLYRALHKTLKSPTASAFLTVVAVILIIILPVTFFLAALANELIGIFANVKKFFDTTTVTVFLQSRLPAPLHAQIPVVLAEGLRAIQNIVGALSNHLLKFFSNAFDIFVGFVVTFISLYYFLKDGSKIKNSLMALSPLGHDDDELVIEKIFTIVHAVMTGILVLGVIKGVLSGFFYWIFGIPAPLFWGAMTGFSSFLPILGSSLITIPAVAYLFIAGRYAAAVGMALAAVAIIGTVDNFLQPKLVGGKTKIHPLLILLSVLGGLDFYGFAGFILGPLTLAVTLALIDIYKKEFRKSVESS